MILDLGRKLREHLESLTLKCYSWINLLKASALISHQHHAILAENLSTMRSDDLGWNRVKMAGRHNDRIVILRGDRGGGFCLPTNLRGMTFCTKKDPSQSAIWHGQFRCDTNNKYEMPRCRQTVPLLPL